MRFLQSFSLLSSLFTRFIEIPRSTRRNITQRKNTTRLNKIQVYTNQSQMSSGIFLFLGRFCCFRILETSPTVVSAVANSKLYRSR
jgi:hypothetical protein